MFLVALQGQYTFSCPALKDGSTESCGKLWPYQEVRRLAVLTDEEQQTFEEKVASLAAAKYCEFKTVIFIFLNMQTEIFIFPTQAKTTPILLLFSVFIHFWE